MRIQRLVVDGFRSIRHLEMTCQPVVVLVGPNNHGKSNLLAALEFALGMAKPATADFCRLGEPAATRMAVELTLGELSDEEKALWNDYFRPDGRLVLRREASLEEGKAVSALSAVIQEPTEPYLKAASAAQFATRAAIEGTPLNALVPAAGRLTKEQVRQAQRQYVETNRATLTFVDGREDIGAKSAQVQTLPALHLVPAVRDAGEEAKSKSSTAFGKLLQLAFEQMAAGDARFLELKGRLEEVASHLGPKGENRPAALSELESGLAAELAAWGVAVKIDVQPTPIEKLLELGSSLSLDDGVATGPEGKGHGLQRALIFALLRLLAKADAKAAPTRSAFFAIEEPELFLHPHAQRDLASAIRALAEPAGRQVFLCTHSTHFVDLDHYREVVIINKDGGGTAVRQCEKDLFEGAAAKERKRRLHMARWVNPDRAEMFFADRVVFVEGETEKTSFAFLAQRLGRSGRQVSVVDVGGKDNLLLYVELAKAFSFDYRVVHDEDPVPAACPPDKKAGREHTFALNGEIAGLVGAEAAGTRVLMLSPNFEGVAGISATQADVKGKSLAALEHFEGKSNDEIPARLREVVVACFPGAPEGPQAGAATPAATAAE